MKFQKNYCVKSFNKSPIKTTSEPMGKMVAAKNDTINRPK